MRRVLAVLLAVTILLAGPGLSPAPAAPYGFITISGAPESLNEGAYAYVRGGVQGSFRKNEVRLQRRIDGAWKMVLRQRITSGSYSFELTPPVGRPVYRVVGKLSAKGKLVTSPSIRFRVKEAGAPSDFAKARKMILSRTNDARADDGLAPLVSMPELNVVAQDWTDRMASESDYRHNPNFGEQYPAGWWAAGENIATGQAPEKVVRAWMGSAGHRANILGNYTHIGIGYARDPNGRTYFTQNFASYE